MSALKILLIYYIKTQDSKQMPVSSREHNLFSHGLPFPETLCAEDV